MKLQTIILLTCFAMQVSLAQTITCPENTFLGVFDCSNIDDVPKPVNMIEEAMAAPYNIEIEGEIPAGLRVLTEDDAIIFVCNGGQRVVTRTLTFIINDNFNPFISPEDIIAQCSFTVETIADVAPIEFIAPLDYSVNCDNPENYPGDVTFIGDDCFTIDQSSAFFVDEVIFEGNIIYVKRTWQTVDPCGNLSVLFWAYLIALILMMFHYL